MNEILTDPNNYKQGKELDDWYKERAEQMKEILKDIKTEVMSNMSFDNRLNHQNHFFKYLKMVLEEKENMGGIFKIELDLLVKSCNPEINVYFKDFLENITTDLLQKRIYKTLSK